MQKLEQLIPIALVISSSRAGFVVRQCLDASLFKALATAKHGHPKVLCDSFERDAPP